MEEKWKDIEGYEGLYQISSMGRVKSLKRNNTKGKVLKMPLDKDGYCQVTLSKNNIRKTMRVHKLVALAFVDGKTAEKNMVNHKNEIKDDNRVENLEWCDAKYNTNYNNMPMKRAEWCRKPIVAVKGDSFLHFESIADAERTLKANHANVCECLHGRRKTVKGYRFITKDDWNQKYDNA